MVLIFFRERLLIIYQGVKKKKNRIQTDFFRDL